MSSRDLSYFLAGVAAGLGLSALFGGFLFL
jgi:hypothetical protein